jgi:hypothetical protein
MRKSLPLLLCLSLALFTLARATKLTHPLGPYTKSVQIAALTERDGLKTPLTQATAEDQPDPSDSDNAQDPSAANDGQDATQDDGGNAADDQDTGYDADGDHDETDDDAGDDAGDDGGE